MDGILVINKPAGYTSFDAVAIARRAAWEKKTGHTGTLDPNATGVLVVCFGKATRLIEYMDFPLKTYKCTALLGKKTDSADIWGEEIEPGYELEAFPDNETMLAAVNSFEGDITQTPPVYSAIKVNGKPLYKYAREGKSVEIKSRQVHVESISLDSYDQNSGALAMTIVCGRGTYIRSICNDLGDMLKTACVMTSLERTSACGYSIEQALDLETLKNMSSEELAKHLLPYETAVASLPPLKLTEEQAKLFSDGNNCFAEGIPMQQGASFAVYCGKKFLGIAVNKDNQYKSYKVFK